MTLAGGFYSHLLTRRIGIANGDSQLKAAIVGLAILRHDLAVYLRKAKEFEQRIKRLEKDVQALMEEKK